MKIKKLLSHIKSFSLLTSLILLIIMAMPAGAQPKDGPPKDGPPKDGPPGDNQRGPKMTAEERAQKITDIMTKKLSLSTEQNTKAYSTFLDQEQKLDMIREENPPEKVPESERDAVRKQVDAVFQSTDTQMQTILSTEQYTQYLDVKKEMRDKMKKRMKDRDHEGNNDNPPPPPPEDGKF